MAGYATMAQRVKHFSANVQGFPGTISARPLFVEETARWPTAFNPVSHELAHSATYI